MSAEEIWDVTDQAGVPTGRTFVRGAPGWPEGRFHVVAAVCVVDATGAVLLTRRGPTKDFPGKWEFPAGSALRGESSAEAASRELREEIGLRVSTDALRLVGRFEEGTALFDLHVAADPASQAPQPDGMEVTAFEWVDLAEVERRRRDRELAEPWDDRLCAFWTSLTAAVDSVQGS